ncbi:hypothetical protein LTR37_005190 [Vermiconidia calcicola]|uniref:Uncharacterized protein n=1 Tax=Vermiconidia calcicola TaxID=1690605 RepID=A0ACC3NJZ8_9PEZI|nr:hypothetical protein LTR37_005190 [Vermiconidia calcicola]
MATSTNNSPPVLDKKDLEQNFLKTVKDRHDKSIINESPNACKTAAIHECNQDVEKTTDLQTQVYDYAKGQKTKTTQLIKESIDRDPDHLV